MANIALLFPGQGAQKVGMGKEFYDSSPEAKTIFDQAEVILGCDLKSAIFDGPQEKLTLTAYCQPAIATFSIAALRAFEASKKYDNVDVKFAAGLSLGEYSALISAGAFSFEDGLKLVQKRSSFMEEATKSQKGTMAAIMGFDKNRLKDICVETGAEVANFNSLDQIVITGRPKSVEDACNLINREGAKAVIPLDVSGAFHSNLMKPAAEKFREELKAANIGISGIPVISNVSGKPENDAEEIRKNLAEQITSSVQWVDSILYMVNQGMSDFIEIGPGKVLKGLLRKIDRNLKTYNIEKPEDIDSLPF